MGSYSRLGCFFSEWKRMKKKTHLPFLFTFHNFIFGFVHLLFLTQTDQWDLHQVLPTCLACDGQSHL